MAIFDKEASKYDNWYQTKMGKFCDKVQTELAFSLLNVEAGMKVLDVACGTGNFSIKLAKLGCEVVAIDKSKKMIAEARIKAHNKNLDIKFIVEDVYNLSFDENNFDAVISMAAFEFIHYPKKAYQKMYKVLKDNGKMLIGTINKESSWGDLYLSEEFQKNSVYQYARFKAIEDLKALNPNEIIASDECLFIPAETKEKNISMELENKLAYQNRGGFICVVWQKKR